MEMPYIGPYRVLWGPDERDRYALRDLHGRRFNEFHVSKLKLWPTDEEIGEDYYMVEQILDRRLKGGKVEYAIDGLLHETKDSDCFYDTYMGDFAD